MLEGKTNRVLHISFLILIVHCCEFGTPHRVNDLQALIGLVELIHHCFPTSLSEAQVEMKQTRVKKITCM